LTQSLKARSGPPLSVGFAACEAIPRQICLTKDGYVISESIQRQGQQRHQREANLKDKAHLFPRQFVLPAMEGAA
jgi:hypothetical protein